MKTFKQLRDEQARNTADHLDEARYPVWAKVTTAGMVARSKAIQNQVNSAQDANAKIELLSKQVQQLSYLVALVIAVNTKDKSILSGAKRG